MPNLFVLWLVTVMVSLAPPRGVKMWDGLTEPQVDGMARYWSVAEDLNTTLEMEKDNLPFSKGRTAAYLLAIAFYESGFLRGVDYGVGKHGKGDFGRSACLLQIQVGRSHTPEGWSMEDLLADRTKCFRRGLTILKASLGACARNAPEHRLAVYASGSCDKGHLESASRVHLAERIATRRKPKPALPVAPSVPEAAAPVATLETRAQP